ncbi:MAG: hypothetical protein M3R55_06665 [Acidobacteriota bacterium]|nr:hypothetical protein [Acidobacteriota bacterium]
MKKAIAIVIAIIVGVPLLHLAYARYHQPTVPEGTEAWRTRADALTRGRVFMPEAPAVEQVDFTRNHTEPNPFPPDAALECRYQPKKISGTTPKFDCRMANGEVIKVKYGVNPEIPSEVATTRLLTALGFGADHMSIVKSVRCFGCPRSPFRYRQASEWFFVTPLHEWMIDFDKYTDFEQVAIERKLNARAFEAGEHEGWAWYELAAVDPSRGGAPRADVDALRLMAVFLAHWDNKSANQRIACLGDDGDDGDARCANPLLMIQDAGATFGPRKVDLDGWKRAAIWRTDKPGCWASMDQLPYSGATFSDVEITEDGRRILADKLGRLTDRQITQMFSAAGFPDADGTMRPGATDVQPWVEVFMAKRREIATRACGPSPSR